MCSLKVKSVNLYPPKNAKKHHTNCFEMLYEENPVAILRRGQKFVMSIHFENRCFNLQQDLLRIIFSYGKSPHSLKGTKVILSSKNCHEILDNKKLWALKIKECSQKNYIILEVISAPDCPVGIWNLKIETYVSDSTAEPTIHKHDSDLYILFNPWCSDDSVYMKENQKLDEYILNDVGKIWIGPHDNCKGRVWIFGQYDACVLPAIMLMFDRSGLAEKHRRHAIETVRTISKMVNSDDDNGILIGRWNGEYHDGMPPSAWTGSVDILKRYLETKQSVGYGQCWVFAGVVTTICRALGIPSRVVSNVVTAQDKNSSLTIDKYYDENNEELYSELNDSVCEESVWNYHVWNDVWMTRPDLLKDFDGWQAIDATPTEKSHGFYQCGPASLEAIKRGVVGLNYDVGFMVASVNADIIRWKEDASCDVGYSRIYCNKYHVGRFILTKIPFSFDPNGETDQKNVTHEYKYKEGSNSERISLFNAGRKPSTTALSIDKTDSPEIMEITLGKLCDIYIGNPFHIKVKIENKSNKIRNFKAVLSAKSVFYNGVKSQEIIKRKINNITVRPNSTKPIRVEVNPEQYLDKLEEYGNIKFDVICTDKETNLTLSDEDDFQVKKPIIIIEPVSKLIINEKATITLSFENPLKTPLTNCKFYVAGPGLSKTQMVKSADIHPESKCIVEVQITPSVVGKRNLMATFTSNELVDITGIKEINV